MEIKALECFKLNKNDVPINVYIDKFNIVEKHLHPFVSENMIEIDFNSAELDKYSFKRAIKRAYLKNDSKKFNLAKSRNFDKLIIIFMLYLFKDKLKNKLQEYKSANFSIFSAHLLGYSYDYIRLLKEFKEYINKLEEPLLIILPRLSRLDRYKFSLEDFLRFLHLTLEGCLYINSLKNIYCNLMVEEWGDSTPAKSIFSLYSSDKVRFQETNCSLIALYKYLHLDSISHLTPKEHSELLSLIPNEDVMLELEKLVSTLKFKKAPQKVIIKEIANRWFDKLYREYSWFREILVQLYVEPSPVNITNFVYFINYEEEVTKEDLNRLPIKEIPYREEVVFNPLLWIGGTKTLKNIDVAIKRWGLTRNVIISPSENVFSLHPLLKLADSNIVNNLVKNMLTSVK